MSVTNAENTATETPESDTDDEFDSGFSATKAQQKPTETPAADDDVTPPEENGAAGGAPSAATASQQTPPAQNDQPQYAQITVQEYQDLLAKAGRVDELNGKLDTSFGRFGQKIKEISDRLDASAAAGDPIRVEDDDVKDLVNEFPEMGGLVRKTLENIVSKIKVGAPVAPQAAPFDPSVLETAEARAVQRAKIELTEETLDFTHEGWRELIGIKQADGTVPQTEYRTWLATQPEDYQKRVRNSFSAGVIGKSIDDFRAAKEAKQQQANRRRTVISTSVTPRGDGGGVPTRSSDDDDFNAGFRGS